MGSECDTYIMLIIERLRPIVWACQFFGLFPFSMEIDKETKEFRKFSFSLKTTFDLMVLLSSPWSTFVFGFRCCYH